MRRPVAVGGVARSVAMPVRHVDRGHAVARGAGTASEGPPDCRAWDALEPVEIQARVVERERAGSVLWLALGTEARAIAVPEDSGGGGGIRTRESLRPAGFQDRCLKPLGHPSSIMILVLNPDSCKMAPCCLTPV